jgi:hypothetical protein
MNRIDGGRMLANLPLAIWDGLRHTRTFLVDRIARGREPSAHSPQGGPPPQCACNSPERLERIAAYAQSGYFHMEYPAGMFVVPLDIPSD